MWTRGVVDDDRKTYLRTFAPELRQEINGIRIRLVHGSPRRMNEYLFEDRDEGSLKRIADAADADVLVFGHTHKPWHREIGGVLFVNTGSAGKPKDGDPRACWVLLTVGEDGTVDVDTRRVGYDIAAMAAAIRAAERLPDRFAEDIETGGIAVKGPA
jgi:putative phosphoesterase